MEELNSVSHLMMATWVQRVCQPIVLSPPITWDAASRGCGAPSCLDFENQRRGKLYETRGRCYADISFKDAARVQRAITIGMMRKIWKYLKVGGTPERYQKLSP